LQDFTGVPAVVDLAAMRSAMKRLGGDPQLINPLIPVDLVIDHSVQTDHFGTPEALGLNMEMEFLPFVVLLAGAVGLFILLWRMRPLTLKVGIPVVSSLLVGLMEWLLFFR